MLAMTTLTVLLACGDKDDPGLPGDGGGDGGGLDGGSDDGGSLDDCWLVRPDECAATPSCVELKAREVEADGLGGWCVDRARDAELVGCMPAEVDCGSAITYATAPALPDACFEFSSTCIVAGWLPCADEAMTEAGDCL